MMLCCREISFSYPGKEMLIPPFSLEFPRGAVTAVAGANGCGKSTLLKIVAGLLAPTSGKVEADGKPLSAISRQERARRIALMSQTPEVPRDITVEEFLGYGRFPCLASPRENRSAVEKILQECGIGAFRNALLPDLSGGERQKVFLAFSLVKEPEILLLDEPFSALDPAAGEGFAEMLKTLALRHFCTVVIVLHDLRLALRTADFILGMKRGSSPFFLPAGEAAEKLPSLYASSPFPAKEEGCAGIR